MKKEISAGCIIFLLLFVTSCSSIKTFKGISDLHGAVYDVKNRPVSGCVIIVDGKERTMTDTGGKFTVSGLKSGSYTLETKSPESESFKEEIEFLNETQFILITVIDNETLFDLTEAELEKKNYLKAQEYITRLVAIDKNNANTIMYTAVVRYLENNSIAALGILQEAEKQGITDAWMKRFKEQLEEENEKNL